MCGIYFNTKLIDESVIKKKLDRINFRGPDYSDYKIVDNRIVLGHNRLAIIDLDTRSNQPFHYLNLSIVFNGEIYNFLSLKDQLIKLGYTFQTTSDTEVLAALYHKFGKKCLDLINGMFAFVIYDKSNKTVFAARDRMGKKPFFYRLHQHNLECSSQPSQIAIGNNLNINQAAVGQYLIHRYIPEPLSIYESVFKLMAGHYLFYKIDSDVIEIEKYYELPENTASFKGSYEDAQTELEIILTESIKSRMISDVPLGCFLSGGIDSTLIAAIASQHSSTPLKTFSVKFNEDKFDESKYASITANHLKTNHTNIPCDINDGIKLIEGLSKYYDEPFGDSSAIPSMLLAQATKKSVTVALSGDGGDEGFMGYNSYDWVKVGQRIYLIPYFLRSVFASVLKNIPNRKLQMIAPFLQMDGIADFIKKIYQPTTDFYTGNVALPNYYDFIFSPEKHFLQQAADYNIKFWLVNDSNVKVDRASMSASLEVRSPFLDYKVIEFARTLPVDFRYQSGNKKRILKDLLYKYVPKEMMDRPKQGFAVPVEVWFRNELKDYVQDTLSVKNLQQIDNIDIPLIQNKIKQHITGASNHQYLIWNLIVLINWLQYNEK